MPKIHSSRALIINKSELSERQVFQKINEMYGDKHKVFIITDRKHGKLKTIRFLKNLTKTVLDTPLNREQNLFVLETKFMQKISTKQRNGIFELMNRMCDKPQESGVSFLVLEKGLTKKEIDIFAGVKSIEL